MHWTVLGKCLTLAFGHLKADQSSPETFLPFVITAPSHNIERRGKGPIFPQASQSKQLVNLQSTAGKVPSKKPLNALERKDRLEKNNTAY